MRRMASRLRIIVCVLLTWLAAGVTPAGADSVDFDAVSDFSTTANPNGVWSYGFSNSLGGPVTLFPFADTTTDPSFAVWSNCSQFPNCAFLVGVISTLPGTLLMHPSSSGQQAVLRFTAPFPGTFQLSGFFQGLDPAGPPTTDVHVFAGGTAFFSGNINTVLIPLAFNGAISLPAGGTIDFAVGYGSNGNFLFDSTGLAVTITGTPIPEPTSLLLLGTGLSGLWLVRRRTRSQLRP